MKAGATAADAWTAASAGTDRCPRCGSRFNCGVAGPAPCPCADLRLSDALQSRLREQFSGCLCLACLQALAAAERAGGVAADGAAGGAVGPA